MASSAQSQADLGAKLASLQARIVKERKILEGFQAMRNATSNQDVIRTCDAKIREAQRTIGWFEDSVRELENRRAHLAAGRSASPASNSTGSSHTLVNDSARTNNKDLPNPPPGAAPSYVQPQAYGAAGVHGHLIKADTPLTTAKISRMLHQLEFKLHVERQYKEGIDKMAKLYMADGDKKARADTENKRVESKQKMVLLSQALKKYKTLDVMGELGEDEDGVPEDLKANLRRPLSGALQITIKSARDLAHAPHPKKSKYPSETIIYVKVEDTPRARTHGSRNDRWNENFEIHVDKANECEVTIYDKVPGEGAPVPIGMLWLRLSDIVEELRRRKMGLEAGPGWVTAARVAQGSGGSGSSSHGSDVALGGNGAGLLREESLMSGFGNAACGGGKSEGIDAWFAVEPEGAIQLHLNFVKSNVRKRPYDAGGLGRQGAVRKRKDSVHEQNGHKFVQKQFYTVVLCALCGEFLLKGAGMQCEDCKYACHAKCYQQDKDEDQLNHRIPHRFGPITNISPNWCCHCGLVLPLGRKHARKCSECGVTAHTDCIHLVPDFCGMSMETANKLLADIKSINSHRRAGGARGPAARQPPRTPAPAQPYETYGGQQTPTSAYDTRPPPSLPPVQPVSQNLAGEVGRLSLAPEQQQQQPQPPQRVPVPPLDPQASLRQQQQQQHPLPPAAQVGVHPPRHSSASTISSFGHTGRDSVGSLVGSYGADGRPVAEPPRQPQPPSFQPAYRQPAPPQQPYIPPSSQAGVHPGQQPAYAPRPQPQPPVAPQYPSAPTPAASVPAQVQKPVAVPDNRMQMQLEQAQQQISRPAQPPAVAPPVEVAPPGPVVQQAPPRAIQQRRIGLDDFNFLAVLGKGNFGKVMLAEEKRSAQLYAIKVLKKEFIIEHDEIESTKSEKRVFLTAAKERHPFLLGLHSCFQTETRIYFVMEYVSGGDLMLHIQREQFTPRRAKYYAAEVLLALEYFHQNGIVYRDLKLDNILLTLDGHVKVADYGLCKEDMWFGKTTSTFCGTPEFMAPEIILEQRYGRAVDWWAFGVLIYEMLLGQSPFRGDDEEEIFDAILEDEPLYPIHMPKDSVSILTKLLTKDPTRRLGASEADAAEIKSHLFFKDTNWDDVFHKRIPAPFYPNITSATDTSNFDAEFTSEQPTLTPVHSTLSAQDQNEFGGFSWTANWAQ
ncbi:Serine/threonine kinase [Rhodotorula mucilaginosa]|uniref:protein kinase C n=1 Tax=Rhodotorula mucilaginosa TaxID=5537 RepID=A0A9P6W9I1_RHOMI|nr:Serine/threonine kinase [Rhodotorula mucilaginosa]